jgi:hypothetical protein
MADRFSAVKASVRFPALLRKLQEEGFAKQILVFSEFPRFTLILYGTTLGLE